MRATAHAILNVTAHYYMHWSNKVHDSQVPIYVSQFVFFNSLQFTRNTIEKKNEKFQHFSNEIENNRKYYFG